MSPDRASGILGRQVRDHDGRPLGRIADLITDDSYRITAAIVVRGRWGRLLGYQRDEATGPWLLEQFARHVLRRDSTEIPWDDLRL
jgi:sporulation protein YlmC with PRC-barrel domain